MASFLFRESFKNTFVHIEMVSKLLSRKHNSDVFRLSYMVENVTVGSVFLSSNSFLRIGVLIVALKSAFKSLALFGSESGRSCCHFQFQCSLAKNIRKVDCRCLLLKIRNSILFHEENGFLAWC